MNLSGDFIEKKFLYELFQNLWSRVRQACSKFKQEAEEIWVTPAKTAGVGLDVIQIVFKYFAKSADSCQHMKTVSLKQKR